MLIAARVFQAEKLSKKFHSLVCLRNFEAENQGTPDSQISFVHYVVWLDSYRSVQPEQSIWKSTTVGESINNKRRINGKARHIYGKETEHPHHLG